MSNAETNGLKTIVDALKPLTSEERQRTLQAALVFLGEEAASSENKTESAPVEPAHVGGQPTLNAARSERIDLRPPLQICRNTNDIFD